MSLWDDVLAHENKAESLKDDAEALSRGIEEVRDRIDALDNEILEVIGLLEDINPTEPAELVKTLIDGAVTELNRIRSVLYG